MKKTNALWVLFYLLFFAGGALAVPLGQKSKIELFYESYEKESCEQYGYGILSGEGVLKEFSQRPAVVGPGYRVGPKDVVQVSIWGSALNELSGGSTGPRHSNFMENTITVDDQGNLIIPEIGMVPVNGRTYEELKQLISLKYGTFCKDCSVSVSIEKPRIISVLVTGNVGAPGYVRVFAGSSLYDILLASGGVTKQGTLRKITIKRPGGGKITADLYQFINSGKMDELPVVQMGDSVHVEPIGPVVLMKGQIVQPGIYEILNNETLETLVAYAGGLLPDCQSNHIEITRFEKGERKVLNKSLEKKELRPANGDIIFFIKQYDFLKNGVTLKGYVPEIKTYEWRENFLLKDVLSGIVAFKPETCRNYGEIKRLTPDTQEPSILSFNPEAVLSEKEKDSPDARIELQPSDEVILFSKESMKEHPLVSISGGIIRPGQFRWIENMSVLNLVRLAGGVKAFSCDQGKVVRYKINRASQWETSVIEFNLRDIEAHKAADIVLAPLDRVIVNERSDFYQTRWGVTVEGSVNYPGSYPIGSGTRLSDVIGYAGGLTGQADFAGLALIRKEARDIQDAYQKTAENILRKGLVDVAANVKHAYLTVEERTENKQSMAIIQNYLDHLENREVKGRITLDDRDFGSYGSFKGSPSDVILQDGDHIIIPRKNHMVTIVGEVYQPASYLYREKARVSDYLDHAGGIAPLAFFEASFIIRKNGNVISYSQKEGRFRDLVMKDGDVLVIPTKTVGIIQ